MECRTKLMLYIRLSYSVERQMRGDSKGKPRVYELALSCHSLIALIAMTLYTVGILKSSEFHTFVCYVCIAM